MDYTQLDKTSRLSAVRQRIAEVERQHFDLSLKVQTPDLTAPPNEMDRSNIDTLATSLEALRTMEAELQ